ncbi:hypothetical protein [Streptomyces sp. Je 1-332]|uniref:hypothetical protein n=1 Tax=Streptomyces sp. Je 1-332 TaxID=3231270 RepID=UPI00345A0970
MPTRIKFNFGDDATEFATKHRSDDVARALYDALCEDRAASAPTATEFMDLLRDIAHISHLIQHLEGWRELAMVKADETSEDADRSALGIAASMPPSRVYRILERNGRPRQRQKGTQSGCLENAVLDEGGTWTPRVLLRCWRHWGTASTRSKRASCFATSPTRKY